MKSKVQLLKNPVLRKNETLEIACGDVMEEISDGMQEMNVAGGTVTPTVTSLICTATYVAASKVLGNPGDACSWTVECQSNC